MKDYKEKVSIADSTLKTSIDSRYNKYCRNNGLGNLAISGSDSEKGKSYFDKSLDQVVLGNYTDDVTVLGTGAQVGLGLAGLDLPAEIRDISADFVNWEWSWGHAGQTFLDAMAFFPVIGSLKYTDEVGTLVKHGDEFEDLIKGGGKAGTLADMMEPAEAARYQEYWGWKYAETSPIEIQSNAKMKIQSKTGYDQIQFKWSDNNYKYDSRWHTRTPGAPPEQGNTWVIERITPGNANGQRSVSHILTGEGEWTPRKVWQDAITARQNGVATEAQNDILKGGHWPAP
ncbi:hypothetical protein [Clostridium sp. HBUAS56017]|uniref:hypothetical protein n=1 Tax=Clostridium sp. HBUAS56017 TaxID=2571128 RepID=UPI001177BCD8|nr:hypothetical protein [Clostridium sp. HBUAS56017]